MVTTERYSHLRPDLFREQTFDVMTVDLSQPTSNMVSIQRRSTETGAVSYGGATEAPTGFPKERVTA